MTNNICVPKPVKRALENAKKRTMTPCIWVPKSVTRALENANKKKYSTVNNIDMVWLLAPNPIDLPFPNKKLLNK